MKTSVYIVALLLMVSTAAASECPTGVDPTLSVPLAPVAKEHAWGSCHFHYTTKDAVQLPDPACTPGAVNPTVTGAVLGNPAFSTRCVRNQVTSEALKHVVYGWYGIRVPAKNSGRTQTCELDHLIDLGGGGGDGLENIWPQCDFRPVPLAQRTFKVKDGVEEMVHRNIVADPSTMPDYQSGLAADWTQYLK